MAANAVAAMIVAVRLYFVYLLLDGDRPFYVGYSSHDRIGGHLYHARHNKNVGGEKKNAVIRKIIAEGRKLELQKVAEGLTRDEAIMLERKLIIEMCRDGIELTNTNGRSERAFLKNRIAELERENARLRSLAPADNNLGCQSKREGG